MTQVLPQVLSAYDSVTLGSGGREAITAAAMAMIDQLNTTPAPELITASVGVDPG